MHFIFGTILFLVWAFFWIRGNIWAAIVGAAPAVILMWFDFADTTDPKFWSHPLRHLDTNPANWIFMLGWFCAAFIPWYIQRRRRSNIEKALYKIERSVPGGDPTRLFANIYVEGYMDGFAAAEGAGEPPVPPALTAPIPQPHPQYRLPNKPKKPHIEGRGKVIAYWVCVWLFVLFLAVQIVSGIVTGTEYPPTWFIVSSCVAALFFGARYIIRRRKNDKTKPKPFTSHPEGTE